MNPILLLALTLLVSGNDKAVYDWTVGEITSVSVRNEVLGGDILTLTIQSAGRVVYAGLRVPAGCMLTSGMPVRYRILRPSTVVVLLTSNHNFDIEFYTADGRSCQVRRGRAKRGELKQAAEGSFYGEVGHVSDVSVSSFDLDRQKKLEERWQQAKAEGKNTVPQPKETESPQALPAVLTQPQKPELHEPPNPNGLPKLWRSLTSGAWKIVRVDGEKLYIETVASPLLRMQGHSQFSELVKHGDSYAGKDRVKSRCTFQGNGGPAVNACVNSMDIEITLVSNERIEGRVRAPVPGWQYNCQTCTYSEGTRFDWSPFAWVPDDK